MDEIEHYRRLSEFVPKFAWDSTVPITVRRGDQLAQHGTGTLFAVGDDKFLITAAHVITSANHAGNAVSAANLEGEFVSLGGNWMLSNDEESDGVLDVAGYRLDEEQATRFHSARFLRLSDVSFDFDAGHGVYCIFGFPVIWTHESSDDPSKLSSKAIEYTTYAYEGNTSPLAGYDERFHLLLEASLDEARDENAMPVEFRYSGGVPARFPADLGGISGCSVWHIGDRRFKIEEWPTVEPRVVGIETSVYGAKSVMRATRWNAAATMLYKCFPQTRPVFALHGIQLLHKN